MAASLVGGTAHKEIETQLAKLVAMSINTYILCHQNNI